MKRFALLVLLVLSLFAVNATVPQAAAWGCLPGTAYCTVGNHAQCDAGCDGPGSGLCEAPGCCVCIKVETA